MAMLRDRRPANPKTDPLEENRVKAAKKQKALGQPARFTADSQEGWLERELAAMKSAQRINPNAKTENTDSLEEARKRAIAERTPRVLKNGR